MVYSHITPRYKGNDPKERARWRALHVKELSEWLSGKRPKGHFAAPYDLAKVVELLKGKSKHVKNEILETRFVGWIYIPTDEQVRERQERYTREQNQSIVEFVLEYKHARAKYLEVVTLWPWWRERRAMLATEWGDSCEVIEDSRGEMKNTADIEQGSKAHKIKIASEYFQTEPPRRHGPYSQSPRKLGARPHKKAQCYPRRRRQYGSRPRRRRPHGSPRKFRRTDSSNRRSSYTHYGPTPHASSSYMHYGPTPHASSSYMHYGPTQHANSTYMHYGPTQHASSTYMHYGPAGQRTMYKRLY